MISNKTKRGPAIALAAAVLALGVAACDGSSDSAVTTSQDVTATSTGAELSQVVDDGAPPGVDQAGEVVPPAVSVGSDDRLQVQSAALPLAEVDDAEVDDLLHMREEEKLAHDVYVTLGDLWGLRVFENIAQAETTHTNAVLGLIERYRLEDPVGTNDLGVFTDPELQTLYGSLVEQGSESVEDALTVGALIEDLDIVDLDDAIARTNNDDIALVYTNLRAGSENHLRAFVRQLDTYDTAFAPVHLTEQQFADIIAASGNGRG